MNNIFVLYGQDRKRIIKKRQEILRDFNIDEFNTSIFDMDETELKTALSDAYQIPFLSERRGVVITNASFLGTSKKKKSDDPDEEKEETTKVDIKPLEDYLSKPVETTFLIIEVPSESLDLKKKFNKTIHDQHRDYQIGYPDKAGITKYMDDFLKSENLHIKTDARNELIRRISESPMDYENELEKIALYTGRGGVVTIDIVENLVTDVDNSTIFDLMKSILHSDRDKALKTYYSLIDGGSDPMMILGFITKRFSQILYTSEMMFKGYKKEDISNELGISSGQAYFLMEDARNTDIKKLSKVLSDLRELDHGVKVDFKYGKEDATGFELFLLKR